MTTTELQTREEFLAARKTGVGGSDVAAILGLSPWDTPLDIYREKTGLAEPKEQTFPMFRGTTCEPGILNRFAETFSVSIERDIGKIQHPEKEHIFCHPDGMFFGDAGAEGIEAKSVGLFRAMAEDWGEDGSSDIPVYYECQGRLNMAACNWDRCHFPVWFADTDAYFVIERDLDIEHDMIERLDSFWFDHVVANVPPPPISLADAKRLWPSRTEGKTIEATPDVMQMLADYRDWSGTKKSATDALADLKEQLALFMEDAAIITFDEKPLFTMKTTQRKGYTVDATSYELPKITKSGKDALAERDVLLSRQNEFVGDETDATV